MEALWLVPPIIVADIAGTPSPETVLLASHLASTRLRTGVAAAAWLRAGQRNVFLAPDDAAAVARTDFSSVRLCIVGKLFLDVRPADWLASCVRAKESGGKLILDVCDYPFAQKPLDVVRFYEDALRLADAVTVNSARMAELMAQHTAQSPQVIEDAILSTSRRPEFAPGKVLELLWFGHINNARYLERMMDTLVAYSAKQRCRLTIVTEPGQGLEQAVQRITAACAPQFSAMVAGRYAHCPAPVRSGADSRRSGGSVEIRRVIEPPCRGAAGRSFAGGQPAGQLPAVRRKCLVG